MPPVIRIFLIASAALSGLLVAAIDSGGGVASLGSGANHSSIGGGFDTSASAAGLIEILQEWSAASPCKNRAHGGRPSMKRGGLRPPHFSRGDAIVVALAYCEE